MSYTALSGRLLKFKGNSLIHQRSKREGDQFPAAFPLGIDLCYHEMMGGFFSIQQQAVITVSEHYAGTAEHLRSFVVEGDICGLEGSAGIKADLLVQVAGDALQ